MHEPISPEDLAARWTTAQRRVEAFIYSLVTDFHVTGDVLQNVAMVVVRKREEYDPSLPFVNWALRIAKLEVLKHWRTRSRDRHVFDDTLVDKVESAHQELEVDLGERRRALADCLQHVEGKSRQALLMRYSEGLKPAEIAKRLGMGGSATRMLLLRTRDAIRKCIEKQLSGIEGLP